MNILITPHPYGQWKDTGIRLEGDAVRSLTATFLEMWNAANDRNNNEGFLQIFYKIQNIRQSERICTALCRQSNGW